MKAGAMDMGASHTKCVPPPAASDDAILHVRAPLTLTTAKGT